ncbi:hypothetical protein [Bacillus horti]|uniref:Uncharacterized protein n=1 Tax=Caldalkalibacillus horti TaxID=77523 RepID=A0ABT9W5J1_9BACI|nr:hypothetical protein [Bacillus horti]MDQ0168519.1 hypothetical protein [Bacillus horti]
MIKDIQHTLVQKRFLTFFGPYFAKVERWLVIILTAFCLILFGCQYFILSSEDNQALANKAIRYEGVFDQDNKVEIKAILKQN